MSDNFPTVQIAPWCNGCTADFDSVRLGSIPDGASFGYAIENIRHPNAKRQA